jgi:hypothetical protein
LALVDIRDAFAALHPELFPARELGICKMRFREKQMPSGPAGKSRSQREIRQAEPFSHARQRLFRESFGQFDEDAPVARVLDFSKGNNEP